MQGLRYIQGAQVGEGNFSQEYDPIAQTAFLPIPTPDGTPFTGNDDIFSPEGQRLYHAEWLNGKLHGQLIQFYPSGNLKSVCEYRNGIKDGVCIEKPDDRFAPETYHLNYHNGLLEGKQYIKGLVDRANYENGKLHGRMVVVLNDDNCLSCDWVNGKASGHIIQWQRVVDGWKSVWYAQVNNSRLCGTVKPFEGPILTMDSHCLANNSTEWEKGNYRETDSSAVLRNTESATALTGLLGNLRQVILCKRGSGLVLDNINKHFMQLKEITQREDPSLKNIPWIKDTKGVNLYYRGNKGNGVYEERWNEQIILHEEYKDGKLNGTRIRWHTSTGHRQMTEEYKDGYLHGKQILMTENGIPYAESLFKDGRKMEELNRYQIVVRDKKAERTAQIKRTREINKKMREAHNNKYKPE